MGAKQTKVKSSEINTDAVINLTPSNENGNTFFLADPRSPIACRTPLNTLCTATSERIIHNEKQQQLKGWGLLRHHLLKKNFGIDLNDPRSPSAILNRTPLLLPNSPQNKTLDLNDTFADLSVDTRAPTSVIKSWKSTVMDVDVDINVNTCQHTIDALQGGDDKFKSVESPKWSDIDFPSTSISGNPQDSSIFYWSSAQSKLDEMPMCSGFMTDNSIISSNSIEDYCTPMKSNMKTTAMAKKFPGIVNRWAHKSSASSNPIKHLENAYIGRNSLQQHKRQLRRPDTNFGIGIYEDSEDENEERLISPDAGKTPRKRPTRLCDYQGKRTPLGCARNRTNKSEKRANSVGPTATSPKTLLPLTSFDDSLNVLENAKVSGELQQN